MPDLHAKICVEEGREDDATDRARDKAIDQLEHVKTLRALLRKGMRLSQRESFMLLELAEELLEPLIND